MGVENPKRFSGCLVQRADLSNGQRLRVALVHDFLVHIRGGERTMLALHELYPEAPIYVLVADRKCMAGLKGVEIRESFVGKFPFVRRHFRAFLPLYPLATESLDLSGYDLVLSSSALFVKNIRTAPYTCHICYCHTPNRYLWANGTAIRPGGNSGGAQRLLLAPLLAALRMWDLRGTSRADYFLANSETTAVRIARFYGRPAEVVYPPVDVHAFQVSTRDAGYFLVVAHLVPYKRVDVVVRAFASLRERLIVVGGGPELRRLQGLAGQHTTFLGTVSENTLHSLYENCRALVFPALKDFGIAAVEAQACGKPVIAFRAGGLTEIVREGLTGLFFEEQEPDSLVQALERFKRYSFDPQTARANAERFDKAVFLRQIKLFAETKWKEFREKTENRVSR